MQLLCNSLIYFVEYIVYTHGIITYIFKALGLKFDRKGEIFVIQSLDQQQRHHAFPSMEPIEHSRLLRGQLEIEHVKVLRDASSVR